tara:strand:- start:562 stop:1371 length:810 start_codon:yes stop_codon:yes gene_type:complete
MKQDVYHTPSELIENRVRVCLVGAGGTGSEMLDGLIKIHYALIHLGHQGLHVTVYDNDTVSATNVARQRFYPGDEGQSKSMLLVQRINLFYGLDWDARHALFFPEDSNSYSQYNLLVTCVDLAAVRGAIGQYSKQSYLSPMLWLDTGNGKSDGQYVLGDLGRRAMGAIRLPNVTDLYPELLDAAVTDALDNDDEPSCSVPEALSKQDLFVNKTIATAACQLIYGLLRYGKISYHGGFVNLSEGMCSPLKVNEKVWASMGYINEEGKDAA